MSELIQNFVFVSLVYCFQVAYFVPLVLYFIYALPSTQTSHNLSKLLHHTVHSNMSFKYNVRDIFICFWNFGLVL